MLPHLARGRLIRFIRVAALAAAVLLAAQASARDFEIRHHERIAPRLEAAGRHLSFVAWGRQFDLELESNAGIVALQAAEQPPAVTLYRGALTGQPGSWARLSEQNNRLRGAIFDGEELWLIDSAARLAQFLDSPEEAAGDATVVFRLSDVSGDLGDLVSIVADASAASQPAGLPGSADLLATLDAAPALALDVGLVATADFAEHHGAQARADLLELFNIVEGIFLTQVGVQLRAAAITILDTNPDLLTSTDASTLLEDFAIYRRQNVELYSLGLAHLFVGRDLDDTNPPTRTVGIANIGVLCDRRYGVGLTQATSSSVFDALITAHEIGHNFGAPHDGDTRYACADVSGDYIMAPQLRSQTQFSQCSVAQMLPEITAATCMQPVAATDLQLSVTQAPPLTVAQDEPFELEVSMANLSSAPVTGLALTVTASTVARPSLVSAPGDDSYCDSDATGLRCVWSSFAPGRSLALRFSSAGTAPGTGAIELRVDSLNELDPSDNALRFEIAVASPVGTAAEPAAGSGSSGSGDSSGGGSLGAGSLLALAALLRLRRRRARQCSRPRAHQGQ